VIYFLGEKPGVVRLLHRWSFVAKITRSFCGALHAGIENEGNVRAVLVHPMRKLEPPRFETQTAHHDIKGDPAAFQDHERLIK
jgi:hypothetical protein